MVDITEKEEELKEVEEEEEQVQVEVGPLVPDLDQEQVDPLEGKEEIKRRRG